MTAQGQILEFSPKKANPEQNVVEQLFQLQLDQLIHDEKYHKEICSLTVHHRINHMALHFAKYTGQLAQILSWSKTPEREPNLKQTIIDTFVISLILANILNKKLSDSIEDLDLQTIPSVLKLGEALKDLQEIQSKDFYWYFESMAIANGQIAKACEKLDHLEPYPFKEEIIKALKEIFKSTLIAASLIDLNLDQSVRKRWTDVEQRSIFYGNI